MFFYSLLKVFEDVVEILDPEMNIDSETGEDIIPVRHKKKLNEIFYKPFIIFIIAIVPEELCGHGRHSIKIITVLSLTVM